MRNEEDQESVIIGTKVETVAFVSIRQDREFEKLEKKPLHWANSKDEGNISGMMA